MNTSADQVSPAALDAAVAQAHIAELQKQRDVLESKLAVLQRAYDRRGEQLTVWANQRVADERKKHEGVVVEVSRLAELRASILSASCVSHYAMLHIHGLFDTVIPRAEKAIWAAGWGRACGLSLDNAPAEEIPPSLRKHAKGVDLGDVSSASL